FALEWVIQINRTSENHPNNSSDDFAFHPTVPRTSVDARPVRSGGGLLGSESAGSATATLATANATTAATAAEGSSTAVNGRSNTALLSMPSVVAADKQTSVNIDTTL